MKYVLLGNGSPKSFVAENDEEAKKRAKEILGTLAAALYKEEGHTGSGEHEVTSFALVEVINPR